MSIGSLDNDRAFEFPPPPLSENNNNDDDDDNSSVCQTQFVDLTPQREMNWDHAWDSLKGVWMTRKFCEPLLHPSAVAPRARAATFESFDDSTHSNSTASPPPTDWLGLVLGKKQDTKETKQEQNQHASLEPHKSLTDDTLTLAEEDEACVVWEQYEMKPPSWTERTLQSITHATVSFLVLYMAFYVLQKVCGLQVIVLTVDSNNNNNSNNLMQ